MQKKLIIIFSIIGVLLVLAGGFWYLKMKSGGTEIVSPDSAKTPDQTGTLPTAAPKSLVWNDPAGFTFQYDEVLKINNHPEDKVNYANLEITEPGKEGNIFVLASDSKYKDVNEWVQKDAKIKGGNVIEAVFGGKPAKKINLAAPNRIIVGAIDDKILFTVELDLTTVTLVVQNADYLKNWQKRFAQIVSFFIYV